MNTQAKEILSKLTLKEKCELGAQNEGSFGRVRRLGLEGNVPQDNPRDGADYFRSGKPVEGDGCYHPVAFPSNAALGMSWNRRLAYETGEDFAVLCRANPQMVTWLFRPGVNIKRSPLGGRNFEYISEDPVVSGELAAAYIEGLQSKGVAATLKHYICNNQEFERMTTNVRISERALREVYLRPFEIAIQKGKPWSVMTSYNRVNGEWVNSNQHVMDLLRKEIGFDGVVVSDFAAVHHTKVNAHGCGMDIELAPVDCHSKELYDAVMSGQIPKETLDEELARVFELCDRLYKTTPLAANMEELHDKARAAAEDCIVLLKNEDILPLSRNAGNVLVLGALAEDPSYMGGGSGHMCGYKVDKPVEEIRKFLPGAVYEPGFLLVEDFPPKDQVDENLLAEAVEAAKSADTVIAFVGPGYCTESEGYDRKDILLPKSQRMLLDEVMDVNENVILVVSCASVIDLADYADRAKAILYSSLAGESFGGAIANILFGEAEPGGRLAETWPVHLEHTPAFLDFCGEDMDREDVTYAEDVYVGYRWYDARRWPVLFPFGHGLSYTEFDITDFRVDRKTFTPDDKITVSCKVKNIGARFGSEVIQIYVKDKESRVNRPEKELKAFEKVALAPGEETEVRFVLDKNDFRFYSNRLDRWVLEDGIFEIMAATDAQTMVAAGEVMLTGGDVTFVYTDMTAFVWFCHSERFYQILDEHHFRQETKDFFRQETNEWCVLLSPLPIYRLTEPILGEPLLTEDELQLILDEMNK